MHNYAFYQNKNYSCLNKISFFPEMCVKNAKRRPKIITGTHTTTQKAVMFTL